MKGGWGYLFGALVGILRCYSGVRHCLGFKEVYPGELLGKFADADREFRCDKDAKCLVLSTWSGVIVVFHEPQP
jgi:hypothetical protein